MKSKLRYGIQKYDVSQLSFVYGKYSWRLTNAVPDYSAFYDVKDKKEATKIIANTCSLLQRLLTGEEKNTELFDTLALSNFNIRTPKFSDNSKTFSFDLAGKLPKP